MREAKLQNWQLTGFLRPAFIRSRIPSFSLPIQPMNDRFAAQFLNLPLSKAELLRAALRRRGQCAMFSAGGLWRVALERRAASSAKVLAFPGSPALSK